MTTLNVPTKYGTVELKLTDRDRAHARFHDAYRLKLGGSTIKGVAVYETSLADGAWFRSDLDARRVLTSPNPWSDRITKHQADKLGPALDAAIIPALATISTDDLEAAHRARAAERLARARATVERKLRAFYSERAEAQEEYDTVRALETDLGLDPTPAPDGLKEWPR